MGSAAPGSGGGDRAEGGSTRPLRLRYAPVMTAALLGGKRPRRRVGLLVPALALAITILGAPAVSADPLLPVAGSGAPTFEGSASCARCHEREHAAWLGSQHQRAMQVASEATVLGDFRDVEFVWNGVKSRFFRRGDRFLVSTDGPDGTPADFEIRYTFGVEPLQQYLVEFPGGRLQALSLAWDTKAARWFHTYAGEGVDHRDVLHWTKLSQNWNSMCATCHSTDLRKNYDSVKDTFATAYSEISVGCEACHGPGSRHLEWAGLAEAAGTRPSGVGALRAGLLVDLKASTSAVQVDNCSRCHALRMSLTSEYRFEDGLLDHFLPTAFGDDDYFADGQQRDEAFIYGSWLQSRMHQRGMRCSDCHDSHSGKLKAPGNTLCTSCHNVGAPAAASHVDTSRLLRRNYDSIEHHHHVRPITCVACHAPKRAFMVVDPRLDHSFRVPRPDLTDSTGSPNACNGCHADKPTAWAVDAVARWYGEGRRREFHYGEAFAAARHDLPGAAEGLLRVVEDAHQPAFVRAGALEQLGRYPGRRAADAIVRGLSDADGQVRVGASRAMQGFDPAAIQRGLVPLLSDRLRAVRIEAARELLPLVDRFAAPERAAWDAAAAELEASQHENAERPQSGVGLALLALARGDVVSAEKQLQRALRLEPQYVPARVNLADLLRQTGRDGEAERLLKEGLVLVPDDPSLTEALALVLVRQGRKPEALLLLQNAAVRSEAPARLVYVYVAALADAGRRADAVAMLEAATQRDGHRDLLLALAGFRLDAGDRAGAQAALARLAAVNPHDPALNRGFD